ncbi:MAG: exosortase H [Methylothermaceae bacteria B42]|nr:MAG: exosortase H [Methylothermaceae bacteria B42]HHJ39535.1 exosortase H [Methylothermaceae bacterium]
MTRPFKPTWFFLWFLALLLALFTVEMLRPVQQQVIIPFTSAIASLSAALVKGFDPAVSAHGIVLSDPETGFAVAIQAGCNGVEALIVFVAAVLAFPSGWKEKLLGIGFGAVTIQGLNLLRIISLFYLGQWNLKAFEWFHLYGWQALIMLDVLLAYLLWLHFVTGDKSEDSLAAP